MDTNGSRELSSREILLTQAIAGLSGGVAFAIIKVVVFVWLQLDGLDVLVAGYLGGMVFSFGVGWLVYFLHKTGIGWTTPFARLAIRAFAFFFAFGPPLGMLISLPLAYFGIYEQ